jgi:hypothetical protein
MMDLSSSENEELDMHDSALNFPHKLYHLLEKGIYSSVIRWKDHGYCFQILDIDYFINELIPLTFRRKFSFE